MSSQENGSSAAKPKLSIMLSICGSGRPAFEISCGIPSVGSIDSVRPGTSEKVADDMLGIALEASSGSEGSWVLRRVSTCAVNQHQISIVLTGHTVLYLHTQSCFQVLHIAPFRSALLSRLIIRTTVAQSCASATAGFRAVAFFTEHNQRECRLHSTAVLTQFPFSADYTGYTLGSRYQPLGVLVRRGMGVAILRTTRAFSRAVFVCAL